jgi:hypothetical protein
MADLDEGTITRIAAANGIPPSILAAIAARDTGDGLMGMSSGSVVARGLSPKDVASDPTLALTAAAQTLKQSFSQYGGWEQALSAYSTGDPQAYQNPNSSTGGFVYSVLGGAATDPSYGTQDMQPQQLNVMLPGLQSLATHMQGLTDMGGVVTEQSLKGFQSFIGGIQSQGPGPGAFKGDDFPWGQCTWLAKGLRPDAQVSGNADQWNVSSQTATPGSIVVYNAGHGYDPTDGHTGIVTKVNANGTFQVLSDNVGGVGEINLGNSTMSDVKGFIPPTSPQQGQQVAEQALQISGDPQAQQQVISTAQTTQFSTDVLTQMKMPVTQANIQLISTMAKGEGMAPGTNNPLATTQSTAGTTGTLNSAGVKSYGSYQQGVAATAQTFMNGNYSGILNAMKSGMSSQQMAQNPQVQANLKTWQGGSNEDVNLLGGEANAPGAPAKPPTPPPPSNPSEVSAFAQQLKALNIDPQRFIENFAQVAGMFRYHGGQAPTLHQYAGIANMDASQQQAYVRAQPHPTNPNLTLGQVKDAQTAASLFSVSTNQRMPYDFESQRFAALGANWQQMLQYYQQVAEKEQPSSSTTTSAAKPPASTAPATSSGKLQQLENMQ